MPGTHTSFVAWTVFDTDVRWIIHAALGCPPGDTVSFEALSSLTPDLLFAVPNAGTRRGTRAWLQLQQLLVSTAKSPSIALRRSRLETLPPHPVDVAPDDEVEIDRLDRSQRWIIHRLLSLHGVEIPARVSAQWIASLTDAHLMAVPGVGQQRAMQFRAAVRNFRNTTTPLPSGHVPWSYFDRRSRWIVQDAIGQPIGDTVSRETLLAIEPDQLLMVYGAGSKRAEFAWQDLQRVLDVARNAATPGGSGASPRGTLGLPVPIEPHDEITLEALDHGQRWIIERLFRLRHTNAPACLSLAWLASLCQQELLSVEGVGLQRAQQFVESMCARRAQRDSRTPAAQQFHDAVAEGGDSELRRLASLKVDTEVLPRDFQACFVRVIEADSAGTPPLAFMLMASVRELCDRAGLRATEAERFVARRDSLFAQHVILRALRMAGSDVDITVATHLMIAANGEDRWSPDKWQRLTGLSPSDLLDSLRRLLCEESRQDYASAQTYLEDIEMLQEMRAGATLKDVGNRHSISRQRVQQRIASLGYRGRLEATESRERADADRARTRSSAETFARRFPGCSPGEMAEGLGLTREVASQLCSDLEWLTLIDDDASKAEQQARRNSEYMHACKLALRQAATLAFPVTKKEYDKLRSDKFIVGPSSARVLQLFRSWRDACDAAGVESGEGSRTWGEHHQWSTREMIDAVARFLVDPRHQGQAERYDEWKKALPGGGDLPSRSTIHIHLKASWSEIRRKALIALRGTWQRPQDANT